MSNRDGNGPGCMTIMSLCMISLSCFPLMSEGVLSRSASDTISAVHFWILIPVVSLVLEKVPKACIFLWTMSVDYVFSAYESSSIWCFLRRPLFYTLNILTTINWAFCRESTYLLKCSSIRQDSFRTFISPVFQSSG